MSKDCEQECGFFNLLSAPTSEQEIKETENESVYRRFSVYSTDSTRNVTRSHISINKPRVASQSKVESGNRFSVFQRHPSNYGQRLWNGMLAPFLQMNLTGKNKDWFLTNRLIDIALDLKLLDFVLFTGELTLNSRCCSISYQSH